MADTVDTVRIKRLAGSEVIRHWRGCLDFWTLLDPARASSIAGLYPDLQPPVSRRA